MKEPLCSRCRPNGCRSFRSKDMPVNEIVPPASTQTWFQWMIMPSKTIRSDSNRWSPFHGYCKRQPVLKREELPLWAPPKAGCQRLGDAFVGRPSAPTEPNVCGCLTWLNLGHPGPRRHRIVQNALACFSYTRSFSLSLSLEIISEGSIRGKYS